MKPAGATLDAAFETIMEGVLIALLVFTPLVFGAVQTWALSMMQAGVAVLCGAWLCRLIWCRRPSGIPEPGIGSLWGYPFAKTGLGVPIALFLALVLLQLAPIPPSLVRLLSPAAAETFARALPGYADSGAVDFARLEPWLLEEREASGGVVEALLANPAPVPLESQVSYSPIRPISVYPFATWSRLIMLGALLIVFLIVTQCLSAPAQRERILWVVALMGFGMSVLGVAQQLQWNGKIYWFYPAGTDTAPYGPFLNHNHFAAYLEMAIPAAFGVFLGRLVQVAARGPERGARLGLSAFAGMVMLAALLLSGSRGAILSLCASVLVYGGVLAVRGQLKRRDWIVGVAGAAAAMGFAAWIGLPHLGEVSHRLWSVTQFEHEPSLSARVVAWLSTLRIVADYPILGSGLGTFAEIWTHYYPAGTAGIWKEAHNDYLQIAAETGAVGLLTLAAGLYLFVRRHLLWDTRAIPPKDAYVHHALAIGILSLLFHSWVDFSLQVGAIALLFVVLSGILVGGVIRRAEA